MKNAEEYFGIKPRNILASVPANFNLVQSNALARAFQLADVKVHRLVGEPCAASVLLHLAGYNPHTTKRILVLDLGGGTLDVSVIDYANDVFEVLSVAGDNNLGGLDYDDALCSHVLDALTTDPSFGSVHVSETELAQIRLEAERAKIALGRETQTRIILTFEDDEVGLKVFELELDRELFLQGNGGD